MQRHTPSMYHANKAYEHSEIKPYIPSYLILFHPLTTLSYRYPIQSEPIPNTPSNLRPSNLSQVVIDDTISNFCNVDFISGGQTAVFGGRYRKRPLHGRYMGILMKISANGSWR